MATKWYINYDPITTWVKAKYCSGLNYPSIPEPYIIISDEENSRIFGNGLFQQPCVVNGVVQEYIKPDAQQLSEAKASKIYQLKINRDNANLADMISHQGEEVLVNRDLIDTKTGEEVFFAFTTKETRNPATNPYTILSDTIAQGSLHDNYYLRYSCKIIEGETARKGYIALDKLLATSLLDHARLRNTNNIGRANQLEDDINAIEITKDITCQEAIKLINDIDIIF
jgi:hypothetical protein